MKNQDYKIEQLEKKVKGQAKQITKLNAQLKEKATTQKKDTRTNRDRGILTSVASGVSQRETARIYKLTPARVNQIVKESKAQ